MITLWTGFQQVLTQDICCSCHRYLGQGTGSWVGPCWSQVQCNQARSRWNWAYQGMLFSTCKGSALLTLLRNALPYHPRRTMTGAVIILADHPSRCHSPGYNNYNSPVSTPCHLHFKMEDCFKAIKNFCVSEDHKDLHRNSNHASTEDRSTLGSSQSTTSLKCPQTWQLQVWILNLPFVNDESEALHEFEWINICIFTTWPGSGFCLSERDETC